MSKMRFALLANPSLELIVPVQEIKHGEKSWNVLVDATIIPHNNNDSALEKAAEDYCNKLRETIVVQGSVVPLCVHFTWDPSRLRKLSIRVHGRLFEELNMLCGEQIELTSIGTLCWKTNLVNLTLPFSTGDMPIQTYSTVADAPGERGCWDFNHAVEAFCEDLKFPVYDTALGLWCNESGKMDFVTVKLEGIWFDVEDDYINLSTGATSHDKYSVGILKGIMRQDSSITDISVMTEDGTKVRASKCFLMGLCYINIPLF